MTNEKGRTNLGQVDECATIEDFARFIGENVFKIQFKSGEKKSWFARILNFFKKQPNKRRLIRVRSSA